MSGDECMTTKRQKVAAQRFRTEYAREWQCLKTSEVSEHSAFCTVCNCDFSVKHGGRDDCRLYFLFLSSVFPAFTSCNVKLQSEAPSIHIVSRELLALFTDLLVRFMKPDAVVSTNSDITEVQLKKRHQKSDENLVIGAKARVYLRENEEILSTSQLKSFYESVRNFFVVACDYMISKLPMKDKFLKHTEIVDVNLKKEKNFSSVEYLMSQFPGVVNESEMDEIELEFSRYQIDELNQEILGSPKMDVCWGKISKLVDASGSVKYKVLPKLMLTILLVPHSNAATERIFSIVRQNATDFRANLGTETLNALMVEKIKMGAHGDKCYKKKFSKKQLEMAKHATVNQLKQGGVHKEDI